MLQLTAIRLLLEKKDIIYALKSVELLPHVLSFPRDYLSLMMKKIKKVTLKTSQFLQLKS